MPASRRTTRRLHRCSNRRFRFHHDNSSAPPHSRDAMDDDGSSSGANGALGVQLAACSRERLRRTAAEPGRAIAGGAARVLRRLHTATFAAARDLWSGNMRSWQTHNRPSRPGGYYGDRECDVAMTELFGATPATFYAAYSRGMAAGCRLRHTARAIQPLPRPQPRQPVRAGYARQAEQMMRGLLTEIL